MAKQWIELLKSEDKKAQGEFFKEYWHKVFFTCSQFLDSAYASDMATDILVDFIYNRAKNIKNPEAIIYYLRTTAARKSRRLKEREQRQSPEEPEVHLDTEEELTTALMSPHLNDCLSKLTPRAQKIIQLRFYREMTLKEVANWLGISKPGASKSVKNSLYALKKCLGKRAEDRIAAKGRKTMNKQTTLSDNDVISLLKKRYQALNQDSEVQPCSEFESVALALAGKASRQEFGEVVEHVQSCSECTKDLLFTGQILSLEQEMADSGKNIKKLPFLTPFNFSTTTLMAACLVFCLIGILTWKLIQYNELPTGIKIKTPTIDKNSDMQIKGETDLLHIGVKRGAQQFRIKPGNKLRKGDHLGFFYSAPKEGYLMIYNLTSEGEKTLLYPKDGMLSAPIIKGKNIRIPDGAVMGDTIGCEWIIAVFSDQRLTKEEVELKLDNAGGQADCDLKLSVPGSRRIQIFQF